MSQVVPRKRNYRVHRPSSDWSKKPPVSGDELPLPTIDAMPRRNGHGIDLLADPTRRRIVSLLALNVFRPAWIATKLELSRPAVSRQLRILLDAQLISRRPYFLDHRGWMYYIDPRKMGQITAWLAGTEVGRAFPTYQDREKWIRAMVPHERNEDESDPQAETDRTRPSR